MRAVDIVVESSLPPDRVRSALLDFSERRPEVWPGITPALYEVYSVGAAEALIREGTKLPLLTAFWAKERYDWSDPEIVRWTVEESNFCAPGSYVSARITPRDTGSRIDLHWERTPTSLPGKLATRMIVATNGKPVAQSFQKALARREHS